MIAETAASTSCVASVTRPIRSASAASTVAAVRSNRADAAAQRPGHGPLAGVASGFRNIGHGLFRTRAYAVGGEEYAVGYRFVRGRLELERSPTGVDEVELVEQRADGVVLVLDGVRRAFVVSRHSSPGAEEPSVAVDSALGSVELLTLPRFVDPYAQVPTGALVAPMPGAVVRIAVAVGDVVGAGQPLMWLEAMKMEHAVSAPAAGVVTAIPVTLGQQVEQGVALAVVDTGSDPDQQEETP